MQVQHTGKTVWLKYMLQSLLFFLFLPLAVLRSINPVKVAPFLRNAEHHKVKFIAKQQELPNIKPASYIAESKREIHNKIVFFGKFANIAPGITDAVNLTRD